MIHQLFRFEFSAVMRSFEPLFRPNSVVQMFCCYFFFAQLFSWSVALRCSVVPFFRCSVVLLFCCSVALSFYSRIVQCPSSNHSSSGQTYAELINSHSAVKWHSLERQHMMTKCDIIRLGQSKRIHHRHLPQKKE